MSKSKRKGYCRYSAYRRIVKRDGERCGSCGAVPVYWLDMGLSDAADGSQFSTIERRIALDLDHVIPLSSGGLSIDDNFQLLCRTCHRRKTQTESIARRAAA